MVKHVLHVQPKVVPDTLEWRLEPNKDGSITVECRELGNGNDSGWNSVVTIETDGKLYRHEYIHTNLLSLVGCREIEIVGPEIPRVAWNKNVEELKQHYGKLVTLVLKDGGSCSKIRHGVLSDAFSKTPGFAGLCTLTGYPNVPTTTYNDNIEKFCVHELPEE